MGNSMPSTTDLWDALSPYESHIENAVGINTGNLGPLIPLIESPVLVVGAGQGLLVEELLRKGFSAEGVDFSPQMVAYAEKRRGIKLVRASADSMPFPDALFKASIVATGVIDFLDSADPIGAIINEVRRVTEARGKIFVASLGMTPQNREWARYLDLLSKDNRLELKKACRMLLNRRGFVREALAVVRNDPKKSMIGYFIRAVRGYMSTYKWTNAQYRAAKGVLRKVKRGELPDPGFLLDYVPDHAFLRSKEQIHALFSSLNFPPKNFIVCDNCIITQLA